MQPRPLWKEVIAGALRSIISATVIVVAIVGTLMWLASYAEPTEFVSDGTCNIAVLPIDGVILPYTGFGEFDLVTTPDFVDGFMTAAEADESIIGVLIEINSPGGTPVASERTAERLHDSTLPVVGLVGDIGASGAYMAAAATDFLIASAMSDIGGIGVNMSYIEESEKNEEEGLTYVQLITGKFKDTGTPNRPITDEERELLQSDLDIVHSEFIDIVAKYRELPRGDVVTLADGATMPGRRALESDLIDAIGGRSEAQAALAGFTDTTLDQIRFCEFERTFLPF